MGTWVSLLAVASGTALAGLLIHHARFLVWHARKGRSAPVGLRWVWLELRDSVPLLWWMIRAFLRDGLMQPERPSGRPVLFVHGYTQNATNFWGLRRRLYAGGRPTVGVSLHHRLAPVAWYAARLERHLERLVRDCPDGLDVVAHSMGGITLRIVLAARADLRAAVRTVVTLGSPHHGTAAARGVGFLPEPSALRRGSALVRQLPHLSELLPHARVVSVAGDADTVVYPVETALVPAAEHVVLSDIGHAGLLSHPLAWEAVGRALEQRVTT
ncbi:MAG: hypothetical protein H6738_20980 [Alphaproteobacteria bacterium]|nr:hypothetical protein [Alphaproteobacteria bacterium]MCB9699268.1 hypothetical protein [Alphaproteobacteria bacterium]